MAFADDLKKAEKLRSSGKNGAVLSIMESVWVERLTKSELKQLRDLFDQIPKQERKASMTHCLQEMELDWLEGSFSDIDFWYDALTARRSKFHEESPARAQLETYICAANLLRMPKENSRLLLQLGILYNGGRGHSPYPILATGRMPSVLRGSRDLSDLSVYVGAVSSIIRPMLPALSSGSSSGLIECARAELFYEQNDLTQASLEIASALHAEEPEVLFAAYVLMARLRALEPDGPGWRDAVAHLACILEKKHAEWLLPNFEAFQARMELLSGNMEAARLWLDSAENEWDGITPENFYRMGTKAGIYLSLGRHQEALSLWEQLQEMISRNNRVLDRADTLSFMALSLEAMGKRELALEKLQEALDLAEPFEYVRVIADKGGAVLPLLNALSDGPYLGRVCRAAEFFAVIYPNPYAVLCAP
ncbi:MAG TPA: tetratricopeptide repeat protein [Oscillospiraceae bacterium]|nr:tetratricopeptide repeat protein [Oscillospiraceae bacterium]HXK78265.1 tetratricopeptide repeat protein [Oscillospiraceae bacterium]